MIDIKSTTLEKSLNYSFKDPQLLTKALMHKSFHFEMKTEGHNERLEFLGDAVVDLVLSEYLMQQFPTDDEGSLSKKRASLVNESVLAKIAGEMGIAPLMILGKGEVLSGGDKKPRLLASTFEAVVGALFLDGGYTTARDFVVRQFANVMREMDPTKDYVEDFKTRLQEVMQSIYKLTPSYRVLKESGPSHDRNFEVEVYLQDKILGQGSGRSKKAAEQEAAKAALVIWSNVQGSKS